MNSIAIAIHKIDWLNVVRYRINFSSNLWISKILKFYRGKKTEIQKLTYSKRNDWNKQQKKVIASAINNARSCVEIVQHSEKRLASLYYEYPFVKWPYISQILFYKWKFHKLPNWFLLVQEKLGNLCETKLRNVWLRETTYWKRYDPKKIIGNIRRPNSLKWGKNEEYWKHSLWILHRIQHDKQFKKNFSN